MAWEIEGTYFENCNCELVCPCSISGAALPGHYERCTVIFVVHINNGHIDGIDVSDRSVIILTDAPQLMSDGNWITGWIIDDKASDAEAEILERFFTGQMGGPNAGYVKNVSENLGVKKASISYVDDGLVHRVRANNNDDIDIDVEIEDFVPRRRGAPERPGAEPARLTGLVHRMGPEVTIALANQAHIKGFGMEWHQSGKNGHSTPFSWQD